MAPDWRCRYFRARNLLAGAVGDRLVEEVDDAWGSLVDDARWSRVQGVGSDLGDGLDSAVGCGFDSRADLPVGLRQMHQAACCLMKAFTARATMRPNTARATVDCTSIVYLWVSGITSVGLNAVAFLKPRYR